MTKFTEVLESARTGYNAGRRLDSKTGAKSALDAAQVKPFVVIVNKLIEYTGSIRKAADLVGMTDATLHGLLKDGKLTAGAGRKILAAYKQNKHHM